MRKLIIILLFLPIICYSQLIGIENIGGIGGIGGIGELTNESESIDTITFTSTQGGTLNQVSVTLQVYDSSDTLYLDWGEDAPVAVYNTSDQVITSAYSAGSTTYTIKLYGHLNNLKKFYIYNENTITLNSDQLSKAENIKILWVLTWNTNFICNSIDLVNMDSLEELVIRTPDPSSIFNTIHLLGKNLKIFNIYYNSINFILNSSDLTSMSNIEELIINASLHDGIFTTYDCLNMPNLYRFDFLSSEPQDTIKSWHLAYGEKNLELFRRFGLGTNDSINSADYSAMTNLKYWRLGHIGTGAYISSNDITQNLYEYTCYPDGGQFDLDLSDFSEMTNLATFFINASTDTAYITAGKLADLPANLTTIYFYNVGNLDITTGTFPAWNACNISLLNSHSIGEVDGFLNAYDAVAGSGTKTIDLRGNNQARSAASDAAVTSLQGKGRTIYTNP